MSKGMIPVLVSLVFLFTPLAAVSQGQIYKVVNPDGSVTYTDQKPSPAAEPVKLQPLSVIATDVQVPETPSAEDAAAEAKEPTARELKRLYRDFRITQPQNEETFWGTSNQVTVAWGASEPVDPEMNVILHVNGKPQKAPAVGNVVLTLDRGEHKVQAELRDANNRRIVVSDPLTFFVKQHSVNFNRARN